MPPPSTPITYGPWTGTGAQTRIAKGTRHRATVWPSAYFGWCGETRVFGISVKRCASAQDAQDKVDAALLAAGAVLEDR